MASVRPAQDAANMIAWLREAANELEKAHTLLDDCQVPRALRESIPMTLSARIGFFGGMIGLLNKSTPAFLALEDEELAILNSLVTYAAENVPGGLKAREQNVAQIVGRETLRRGCR